MEAPAKKARFHFGSLEEQEKKKVKLESGVGNGGVSAAVLAGIAAGNINISNGECALIKIIVVMSGQWCMHIIVSWQASPHVEAFLQECTVVYSLAPFSPLLLCTHAKLVPRTPFFGEGKK